MIADKENGPGAVSAATGTNANNHQNTSSGEFDMTSVNEASENSTPDDQALLDESDFREHMADEHPHVQPNSPLWFLQRRSYFHTIVTDLVEQKPPFMWAEQYLTEFYERPVWTLFCSEPLRLNLTRHPGKQHPTTSGKPSVLSQAHASLFLAQNTESVEPHVRVERIAQIDGKLDTVVGSHYRLTLDEAAEMAHLLLLLVDVARGTDTAVGAE